MKITDVETTLRGTRGNVTIKRIAGGVPHIRADHEVDLYWGLTASEVHAVAQARHAMKWLRIFPDTPALDVRCAIPRGGVYRGRERTLPGSCATVVQPSNHVRRVEFDETFRTSPRSKLSEAGWIVTFSRNGYMQSIRVTGQPPQYWK